MLLAGGQGSRLGVLTREIAKPAVPFGGKYRIIDFPLSNCVNSDIDTVGVLTQYQPHELNAYIGDGRSWDLDRMHGGVRVLPPYIRGKMGEWYKGTANAIYQNIPFIERYDPEYVLILAGDHIYKMDYDAMLAYHKEKNADCTIAVIEVPMEETSRFGIMNTNPDGSIYEFEEKPKVAKSNKASMGVYIFTWEKLRFYLEQDEQDPSSSNDFGKNIILTMLNSGERMYAYGFSDYWRDVGTVDSLWSANMDLLNCDSGIDLNDPSWKIYSRNPVEPPHFIGPNAIVHNSTLTDGSEVYGEVRDSIISFGAHVGPGALVDHSVIMPGASVAEGAVVRYSIIGEKAQIGPDAIVGGLSDAGGETPCIALVGGGFKVGRGAHVDPGDMVEADIPDQTGEEVAK